jgi:hypothetical protein
MNDRPKKNLFAEEMEKVLASCRDQIRRAVREYEAEIDSALEDLRDDLSYPKRVDSLARVQRRSSSFASN